MLPFCRVYCSLIAAALLLGQIWVYCCCIVARSNCVVAGSIGAEIESVVAMLLLCSCWVNCRWNCVRCCCDVTRCCCLVLGQLELNWVCCCFLVAGSIWNEKESVVAVYCWLLLLCYWVNCSWNWVRCCCVVAVLLLGQLELKLSPLLLVVALLLLVELKLILSLLFVGKLELIFSPLLLPCCSFLLCCCSWNWSWNCVRFCCIVAALLLGQLELKLSPMLLRFCCLVTKS